DPASQKCFDMASKWLETCIKTHIHRCRIDETDTISDNIADTECVKFPTRILDVGNDNSEGIRLIESSELTGQYATLSHRWPNDPAKHFKTTSSSIDRYKTSIVIDEMPPTFQDAVRVTRKLGLKYLWIDSLCILQDSVEDWERESAVMGLIYYHSTVTIMAANNLNQYNNSPQTLASENFLHRVIAVEPQIVKLQFRSEDGTIGGHWYLRHQKPILAGRWDLFSRGWVLQEEQLSRRKIMFLGDCIFWQCHMHMIPDFQRDVILDLKKADESKSWKDQFFSDHWFGTAEMYSERTFTFETDKLPGLSGLASHLSQRHGKSYYAGIFSDSIADGLLWSPARPGCLFRTDSTSYIAPSWSWLSAHGSI
ncbi:HET-domain-containing protein, partial [Stipitochalara longipes BDJ]